VAVAVALLVASCGGTQAPPPNDGPLSDSAMDDDGETIVRRPVITHPVLPGFALPYSLDRIFGTFGDCRSGGRRQHSGLDLGGVGDDAGVGTPVRSMVRARITFIGRGEDDPEQFGVPDDRDGFVIRGNDVELPRRAMVRGYGLVNFFTRDYGSWRSGDVVVTEAIGSGIDGYVVRYMHIAEPHPELSVGDEVEAGQELGLMGGTAVQRDLPHVHIDMSTPDGERVDIAPFLGMAADLNRCR
jgi:murein DD-endopeptidase MepM/ murein hydrolase activator NlpD